MKIDSLRGVVAKAATFVSKKIITPSTLPVNVNVALRLVYSAAKKNTHPALASFRSNGWRKRAQSRRIPRGFLLIPNSALSATKRSRRTEGATT